MTYECANSEGEYYALEELHDTIGIIPNEKVFFVVGDRRINNVREQDAKYVIFSSSKEEDFIPQKIETYIHGDILYVKTDILGCIVCLFRAFGARQVVYNVIYKLPTILEVIKIFRDRQKF